jgi:hypothetical protein
MTSRKKQVAPYQSPFYGYRSQTALDTADRAKRKLLAEANLLESLGDVRYILLREAALSLPLASLERLGKS